MPSMLTTMTGFAILGAALLSLITCLIGAWLGVVYADTFGKAVYDVFPI